MNARVVDYVFAFVLLLAVLIFVHELGHFLVARWLRRAGAQVLARLRPASAVLARRHAAGPST